MKTLGTLEKKEKLSKEISLPPQPPRAMTAVGENNDELVAAGAASSAHYDTTRASLGLLMYNTFWLPQFRFLSLKPMLTHGDQFEACFENVLPEDGAEYRQ